MRLATSSDRAIRIDAADPRLNREIIARILHAASARRDGLFVVFRTSATPDVCAEQKLLGPSGLCARANRGTLYIDDFCALPPSTQCTLLRMLREDEPGFRLVASSRLQNSPIPGLQILQGPYNDIPASVTLPPLSEWSTEMRVLLGHQLPSGECPRLATSIPQPTEAAH
jgi:transcriptional regulator with AAA-type ATPase domain